MRFRQLEYVLVIADELSFSKASRKLFIAQPSLSQSVSEIENELGVKIFNRQSKPISITFAGKIFIKKAREILEIKRELDNQICEVAKTKKGLLKVGASPFRSSCIIPEVFRIFKNSFPEVQLDLIVDNIPNLEILACKDYVDIFIGVLPIKNNKLTCEHLFTEKVLLSVPLNHPINNQFLKSDLYYESNLKNISREDYFKNVVDLSLFSNDAFILTSPEQNLHKLSVLLCSRAGFNPNIIMESKNLSSILSMVLAGIGISFIPETFILLSNIAHHPIYYKIDDVFSKRDMVIAYKKNRPLPKIALEFKKILEKSLKNRINNRINNRIEK